MNTKYKVGDIVRYMCKDCKIALIHGFKGNDTRYRYIVEYFLGWGIKNFDKQYPIISGKLEEGGNYHYVEEEYIKLIKSSKRSIKPFIYY